jgi:hypothetical protein
MHWSNDRAIGSKADSGRACFQNSLARGTSIALSAAGGFMKEPDTTNLDAERAEPLGDTGDGDTGVLEGEQGISNRAGDKAEDTVADEFEEDFDELNDGADGAAEPKSRG